ncbi:hypothetical protein FNT36_22230 [Hymenobacter setariae]|uniref:DUF2029 domain-containing protein n=1 Tax=Hymenobacter setariae TaxID=2594794 RepID=A0A558BMZ7_9BACT|nr:hypothetical protein [Hymenobacter setariae]TVT37880.1 hypothetical protein FNT36_22230 [Hymenobacter setariae]
MLGLAKLLEPGRGRRWLLPWALGLGMLLNLAYPMYRHYDFSHSLDTRSYLRLAAGRFDSVNVTRRYRVLVPAAAGILAQPIARVYGKIWPQRPAGEWPRRFAFFLVNCALLGAAGATWWRAARLAGASTGAVGVALLAVLSSRWAEYIAGLPLVDSLYLLVFGLSYYAWRRGPGAGWAVAAALLVGPLAKESFVFLLPWLGWYGRRALGWRGQLAALAVGVAALGAVHYFIDTAAGAAHTDTITNALAHRENILYSLRRAASPKGLGELLSIFGLFTLPVLLALGRPAGRRALAPVLGWAEALLFAVVVVHMLLSSELGRMGYLFAPVFTAALALVAQAAMDRFARQALPR